MKGYSPSGRLTIIASPSRPLPACCELHVRCNGTYEEHSLLLRTFGANLAKFDTALIRQVSMRSRKGTLAQTVLSALVGSGLSPDRLEIEVTETAMLGAEANVLDDLRRLRDMGVRVALDDFGTGYSSLSHLRIFPFDKIKIDGSFVKEAVDRPESAAVIRAVADLGSRLGVSTVAEGVETQAQLDRVREEGCTEVQGYLYGRPAPSDRDAAKIEELNNAQKVTVAA